MIHRSHRKAGFTRPLNYLIIQGHELLQHDFVFKRHKHAPVSKTACLKAHEGTKAHVHGVKIRHTHVRYQTQCTENKSRTHPLDCSIVQRRELSQNSFVFRWHRDCLNERSQMLLKGVKVAPLGVQSVVLPLNWTHVTRHDLISVQTMM